MKEIWPTMEPSQISNNGVDNLNVEDLAVIADKNLLNGTWPHGRVVAVFSGKDGVVRVVDVTTNFNLRKHTDFTVIFIILLK